MENYAETIGAFNEGNIVEPEDLLTEEEIENGEENV